MKMLKPIPVFQSELDERRFWEMNDASDYFDLNKALRVATPNLRPHSATMKSQVGVLDLVKEPRNQLNQVSVICR